MLYLFKFARQNLFIVLFVLKGSIVLFAQNTQINRAAQTHLQYLDSVIKLKKYTSAFAKIEALENKKEFTNNQDNSLALQFVKSNLFYKTGEKEKATAILLKGINTLRTKPANLDLKVDYSFLLAKIFYKEQNYTKSRGYYRLFYMKMLQKKDTTHLIYLYTQLGNTFYKEEQNDSAKYYYTKATKFQISTANSTLISDAYNNLSLSAARDKDYDLAEQYGLKSFQIIELQKDSLDIATALVNMSNVLYPKKEYAKIKTNYLNALAYIDKRKDKKALNIKYFTLFNLSYVHEELKDYKKAHQYLEKANELKAEIDKETIAQNILEIEAKYNVANEARKVEEEKSKRLRAQIWLYGTAIGSITILLLGYIFYRNFRLKQKSKLEQVESELQTKIINATIDAKEKERKSIAETLHDSVSALLSSANLHLQATKAKLENSTPREVYQAQDIVNEASVKIRDLSHELISSVLLKFGLAFAVHDMCQKYSNSQISFHSDERNIVRYNQDFEIKIHNIIEELINNILKHSKATQATIMLTHRKDDKLSIRITDDGIGFDLKNVRGKDGLGLSHIDARIKVMKGVFNIVSSKEDGTNVFILVPIELKD